MADERLGELITELEVKSKAGSVKWEQTVNSGAYQTSFPGYSVEILTGGDHGNDYILRVFDADGGLIDEVSDRDFGDDYTYHQMESIHRIARRHALGLEQAINTIMAALRAGDKPKAASSTSSFDDDMDDPFADN